MVDAEYATSTFLHTATEVGIPVIARLKDNLPEQAAAADRRFNHKRPHRVLNYNHTRVELWDADDFGPWETLNWKSVRVLRYRQIGPDGTILAEAQWLTNLPLRKVGSLSLFKDGQKPLGGRTLRTLPPDCAEPSADVY